MSLVKKVREDMLVAMKQKDLDKLDILKMSLASFKNAEISKGKELDEKEQIEVLRKEVKKLKDAYEQYVNGGRDDLAEKEKKQLEILEAYLPKLMEDEDVREIVVEKKKELGVDSVRDMGKLMGVVMKELQGKADGSVVKKIVEETLNEN